MSALGLLSILAMGAGLALRYRSLRPRLDARARRRFLAKAGAFLGLTGAATGFLAASAGALPLPFAWTLLPVVTASALLLGLLKRS